MSAPGRAVLSAVLCATLLPGLSSPLRAQQSPGGPPRADVAFDPVTVPASVAVGLPASSVALALGNVGIVSRDADVLFYNPGMLSQAGGLAASVQRFGSASTAGAFASLQSVGRYAIGLGVRFVDWNGTDFSYGNSLGAGTFAFGQDGEWRASSLALTTGVGRSLGPVRLGVSASYVRETFGAGTDESVLFDAGATISAGPGTVGLSVQQMGDRLVLPGTETNSPWLTTVGYGTRPYPVATFVDLAGVAQLSVDSDGEVRPAGGAELSYVPVEGLSFAARVGFRRPRDDAQSPVTTGLGVSLDRVSLDYALDPQRLGPVAHRIGIRIR